MGNSFQGGWLVARHGPRGYSGRKPIPAGTGLLSTLQCLTGEAIILASWWKPLAVQANGTRQLSSVEDALRGNWGRKHQHGNLDTISAGRKHGYSTSLEFPGPLGDACLPAQRAWTVHPIRDFESRTNRQLAVSASHMLMLHSQPCTGFNSNETTICRLRRSCYMLCVRHFKRLVHLQFKFV